MATAKYRRLQEHVEAATKLARELRDVQAVRNPWEQEAARIAHVRLESTGVTLASFRERAEKGVTSL